ncbi:LTA synthase family protein [Cytobacillus sp. Hz8]|uniref:LTA synthase family protein n=1 Tax=Cytobacillus sp. Hz8 TaxID=3347168 RepID=UPI0035DD232C
MRNFFANKQFVIRKPLVFFLLAAVLLWIKTYVAYLAEFNLGIDNSMQRFLLFINPISSSLFFLGIALLAKGKKSIKWILIIDALMSFLLYSNIVYYRFFADFITLPTLTQTKNFGDLGQSVFALLKPYDILYFIDIAFLLVLVFAKKVRVDESKPGRFKTATVFLVALGVFFANLGLAEVDRPQLLTRTFDRNYIVKYLGMYNYTLYDAYQSSKASAQRALADSSDIVDVQNFTKAMYAKPNPEYFGKAKGMNVIYLHLESFQNFMINYKLNGKEVTPFLNSLTHDSNTLYFDNFFHETGQGKTADAEFMLENSLFGLSQGSAFSTKSHNTFQAAPAILGQKGYTSAVFHGNTKSFWNRDEIYKSFGFDKFFDSTYFNMSQENVEGYGLKDKPFFKEAMPYLKTVKQPFYTKFITLTNHFPYPLDKEEATIEPQTTGDKSVDNYFQTARYLDEAIEQFFGYLKEAGLYDNTMVILYGDHYGISNNHNKAMSQVLGKEVNDFESAQLQRVPLFIHVPGIQGKEMDQYGGQIDLLPTVLHLLGIDSKEYIQFGSDLLSKQHSQVVPFRDGNFVTNEITAIGNKYYDNKTGELVKENDSIKQAEDLVQKKLELSDKVVSQDLLRFYNPAGFTKVDPTKYNYTNPNPVNSDDDSSDSDGGEQ